jgi:hypothetical protein
VADVRRTPFYQRQLVAGRNVGLAAVDEFANRTGKGDGDASCVVLFNIEVFLLFLFLLIFVICSYNEELAAWTTNRA